MRYLMKTITYEQAKTIVSAALAYAREQNFKPLGVAVLDVRGALTAYGVEDGASLGRSHVAIGKASGVIEMGLGARKRCRCSSARLTACFRAVRFRCRVAC
jgi:uncharacterized protein GlcG (DUF336 family)